jgi:hypothetical protein
MATNACQPKVFLTKRDHCSERVGKGCTGEGVAKVIAVPEFTGEKGALARDVPVNAGAARKSGAFCAETRI